MAKRIPIGELKQCTRCPNKYPNTPDYFYRKHKGDDIHLCSKCIDCMKREHANWRKKNSSKARERCNRNYHKNIEKSRAQSRARNKRWHERQTLRVT